MSDHQLGWANSCSVETKGCVGWIERYFKDCVCSPSSEISFALGLVSLFCWGVAEIPQIITNFQAKSGHGVSLAFLLTWVLGDVFNLVGCLLEPVTLPTQFYTAVLYTIATVVLVLQTIYYDYCPRRWWSKNSTGLEQDKSEVEEKRVVNPRWAEEGLATTPIATTTMATATRAASPRIDMYYTSARSLASSGTPPLSRSSYYLGVSRSGPSGRSLHDDSSSCEEEDYHTSTTNTTTRPTNRIASRSVGYGTFIIGSVGLPYQGKALMEANNVLSRKILLKETSIMALNSNTYGVFLGWIMASIYMGGRLPQIYLNIKRGNVEGLNPFMFLFALIANATYVGSILVRSTKWERLKSNVPWLLDAAVCVLLDLLIILQYVYYKLMQRTTSHEDDYGVCEQAKKPLV